MVYHLVASLPAFHSLFLFQTINLRKTISQKNARRGATIYKKTIDEIRKKNPPKVSKLYKVTE